LFSLQAHKQQATFINNIEGRRGKQGKVLEQMFGLFGCFSGAASGLLLSLIRTVLFLHCGGGGGIRG
jgi:hypothetical protein